LQKDNRKNPSVTNVPFRLKKGSLLPSCRNCAQATQYGAKEITARIAVRETEEPVAGDLRKERRKSLQAARHGAGFAPTGHQSCGGLSRIRSWTVPSHCNALGGNGLVPAAQPGLVKRHSSPRSELHLCSSDT